MTLSRRKFIRDNSKFKKTYDYAYLLNVAGQANTGMVAIADSACSYSDRSEMHTMALSLVSA